MTLSNFKYRLLVASFLLSMAGLSPLKAQKIGANFNESTEEAFQHYELLKKEDITWVRGFIDIPKFLLGKDKNQEYTNIKRNAIISNEQLKKFLAIRKKSGDKINLVFSLKIPFERYQNKVPAPGTKEMDTLMEAIEFILKQNNLGKNIAILVMGNEPEWENGGDGKDYGVFLNLLADNLAAWKKDNGWNFQVFAGALNRVSELKKSVTIPAVIEVVNQNPNIAGLDLHIHCQRLKQAQDDLKAVREKWGVTKEIIVTEFSMVRALDDHRNDSIGEWGIKYGYPAEMKMYEWLNRVAACAKAGNPVCKEEFSDFFASRQWYPFNWYEEFYCVFKQYGVSLMTGRFVVNPRKTPYTEKTPMWNLGGIYSAEFMGVEPKTGFQNPSPLIYPQFKKIINQQ